jgi:hypothetical protein
MRQHGKLAVLQVCCCLLCKDMQCVAVLWRNFITLS